MALGQSRIQDSVPIPLTLLVTLFDVAGVFVIFEGLRTVSHGAVLQGALVAALGVFFLSIPALMLALLIHGRREECRRAELRVANPDRPWMWRQDFSSGMLSPEGDPLTAFAPVFSVFWTVGALAGAWAGIREFLQTGRMWFLITLVFPAIGAALLLWAATSVRRWIWYRRSVLRLEATPVEIGGTLKGSILIPRPLHAVDGFELTLDCVRRTRDADGDTNDSVMW